MSDGPRELVGLIGQGDEGEHAAGKGDAAADEEEAQLTRGAQGR